MKQNWKNLRDILLGSVLASVFAGLIILAGMGKVETIMFVGAIYSTVVISIIQTIIQWKFNIEVEKFPEDEQ